MVTCFVLHLQSLHPITTLTLSLLIRFSPAASENSPPSSHQMSPGPSECCMEMSKVDPTIDSGKNGSGVENTGAERDGNSLAMKAAWDRMWGWATA